MKFNLILQSVTATCQRTLGVFLIAVAFLSGCGGGTTGTDTGGPTRISGTLKSESDQGISNAAITIVESGDSTASDSDGNFEIDTTIPSNAVTFLVETSEESASSTLSNVPTNTDEIEVALRLNRRSKTLSVDSSRTHVTPKKTPTPTPTAAPTYKYPVPNASDPNDLRPRFIHLEIILDDFGEFANGGTLSIRGIGVVPPEEAGHANTFSTGQLTGYEWKRFTITLKDGRSATFATSKIPVTSRIVRMIMHLELKQIGSSELPQMVIKDLLVLPTTEEKPDIRIVSTTGPSR